MQPHDRPDSKNLIIALLLAVVILGGWHYFVERPRLDAARVQLAEQEKRAKEEAAKPVKKPATSDASEAAKHSPRIAIHNDRVHGSFALIGGRIDDITLRDYRESLDKNAKEVRVLSRVSEGDEGPYFAEFGLLSTDSALAMPGANTPWKQVGNGDLTPQTPVTLEWTNDQGVRFEKEIALDADYMFTVTYSITNTQGGTLEVFPYGLINRTTPDKKKHFGILHEGPIGVAAETLHNITYQGLREEGAQQFEQAKGWAGITDKYWLAAMIPATGTTVDMSYRHLQRAGRAAYQVDMRGAALQIAPGETAETAMRFYAGAKEVKLLDHYRAMLNIPLFDRAVDFGMLYFLTKPIFLLLNFFHGIVGNFGIAILILTVCIKALMFPLANKSYTSMSQMKLLMPKMQELREKFAHDKMKMNLEIMEMYKREKVNPMSGCLPILLQIPVFFALYKVLFVTIEMRHAPFFGWVHDLSAPDPTSIFNLFGLLPYDVSALPAFLSIGIWPLIMCATMILQQRLNPKPTDEIQAAVIKWMPYLFLFMFASFPAGLVIYWAWNNTLSIAQQWMIQRRLQKKHPELAKARNAVKN